MIDLKLDGRHPPTPRTPPSVLKAPAQRPFSYCEFSGWFTLRKGYSPCRKRCPSPDAECKIGLRVTSPRSCKIGLSNHSRTWPEQIELFVFQLFSELSKTFEQIELFAFQLFSELSKTFASAALSAVSTCSSTAPGGAPAASGMA